MASRKAKRKSTSSLENQGKDIGQPILHSMTQDIIGENHTPISDSESSSASTEDNEPNNSETSVKGSVEQTTSENERNKNDKSMNTKSKLFVPHRTVGIVTSGKGFTYNNAGNETFLSVPIGDRFQMIRCDKLVPVLVSEALPLPTNLNNNRTISRKSSKMELHYIVSDPSLQISVAAYGRSNAGRCTNVALYNRVKVLKAINIFEQLNITSKKKMSIVQMMKLGKIKMNLHKNNEDDDDDKGGKSEAFALIALLCASQKESKVSEATFNNHQEESSDSDSDSDVKQKSTKMKIDIKLVGDSSSDEESSSSESESDHEDDSDIDSDDSDDDDEMNHSNGSVIILAVSRKEIRIWNYIPFIPKSSNFDFHPICSCNPSTYINKIVVGGTKGQIMLLNIRTRKVIHEFQCCLPKTYNENEKFQKDLSKYDITVLEQSPAVDTIAAGTRGGVVHLLNLKFDTKLFSLSHADSKILSLSFRTDTSAAGAGIAPLAVGNARGSISVWDLTDQTSHESDDDDEEEEADYESNFNGNGKRRLLCTMTECHVGGIAHLTFLPSEPILVTSGSMDNSIKMHIFDSPDFTSRMLRSRCGHFAPPKFIRYLHGGTGGNGGLVLANQADGTDAASCQILSAAMGNSKHRELEDRTLRIFSTVRSVLDKEYSQGKGLEKRARALGVRKADLLLPEIKMFATCETRSRDWGDLVTIHKNHAHAYVWSNRRGAQSGPVLRQDSWNVSAMKVPPPASCHATSVTISVCGNFALVGTRGGVIYKYNMQSGIPRGSYPRDAAEENENLKRKSKLAGSVKRTMNIFEQETKMDMPSNLDKRDEEQKAFYAKVARKREERKLIARHNNAAVVGIAIDSLNRSLISVGSDGKLIVWSFTNHTPNKKSPFQFPSGATKLCHIRDNDLAAIALEDFSVVIFDCSTLSVVRRFGGSKNNSKVTAHTGPVSDLGFGPDGRRLFSSSLDGSVRVWDVPTGSCVDWMSFPTPPTSLSLSATGEFLATTHVGQVGISLWCDKSFFQTVFLDGQRLEEPAYMDSPSPIAEHIDKEDLQAVANMRMLENSSIFAESQKTSSLKDKQDPNSLISSDSKIVAKADKLVTMSGLPPSHWKTLFHLELVRERNKPKEPPKKPPSAPFFLQWRGGETDAIPGDVENSKKDDKKEEKDDAWNAVWSDDDDNENFDLETKEIKDLRNEPSKKREVAESTTTLLVPKKRKVSHLRSHLTGLLDECDGSIEKRTSKFAPVTQYMATLGPSAVDVELSTLCHGMHDLEEGLPLLQLSSSWLLEACESRQSFEAINAYLNRFLTIYSNLMAGIEEEIKYDSREEEMDFDPQREEKAKLLDTIAKLRNAQTEASETLRGKMQHTLCLLKHFSRMI